MIPALYERFLAALAAAAGTLLVFFTVSESADVLARYLLGRPIGWVLEFNEHGLLFLTFLGMPWLVRRHGHVRIDILVSPLPRTAQRLVSRLTSFAAAATCAVAGYWATMATWDHFRRGVLTSGIYQVPKYGLLAVIALGFIVSTVEFLRLAFPRREEVLAEGRLG